MKQIKMDYRVEFEDGLKDQVTAYYIGGDDMYLNHALGLIKVSAGIGIFRVDEKLEEKIREETPNLRRDVCVNIYKNIHITMMNDGQRMVVNSNEEEKMLNAYKEKRTNVIQVYQLDDISHAIHCHFDDYMKQFHVLASDFGNHLSQFMKNNKKYFSGIHISEDLK